jgi:hypothetical protein
MTIWDLHSKSVDALKRELSQLGFALGGIGGGSIAELYPHFLTHPIGIGKGTMYFESNGESKGY